MSQNNNIKCINITNEALSNLEGIINNSEQDGLEKVVAKYDENENTFSLTLTYMKDTTSFERFIVINLENK